MNLMINDAAMMWWMAGQLFSWSIGPCSMSAKEKKNENIAK